MRESTKAQIPCCQYGLLAKVRMISNPSAVLNHTRASQSAAERRVRVRICSRSMASPESLCRSRVASPEELTAMVGVISSRAMGAQEDQAASARVLTPK